MLQRSDETSTLLCIGKVKSSTCLRLMVKVRKYDWKMGLRLSSSSVMYRPFHSINCFWKLIILETWKYHFGWFIDAVYGLFVTIIAEVKPWDPREFHSCSSSGIFSLAMMLSNRAIVRNTSRFQNSTNLSSLYTDIILFL